MKHRVAHSNFGGEFCLLGDSAMRSKVMSLDKRRENYARGTNLSLSLECRDSDAAGIEAFNTYPICRTVANANIEYVLVKE
ncbi:hypothetical protein MUK42_01787 [Musa troglodytarum]|uniref:Uncharacterized protein n=1 Tax=Musa troglodytarum TaxID=320322 RepID=A0A9E7ELT9_9LILI|nr:hypothetical protein MUK42_01787 [Musa troglodytarum]